MMRKALAFILAAAIALSLLLTSCSDDAPIREWEYNYDPYYNLFKDDVSDKYVKVSGNIYLFEKAMVRDKDANLKVTAGNALASLYEGVMVRFINEETLEIIDYSGFYPMSEKSGVREGNVLTVQNTNKTGDYIYDIRIEIHKDKVVLIHNGHTYNTPGMYSTLTFLLSE